jgi:hypothetical protein
MAPDRDQWICLPLGVVAQDRNRGSHHLTAQSVYFFFGKITRLRVDSRHQVHGKLPHPQVPVRSAYCSPLESIARKLYRSPQGHSSHGQVRIGHEKYLTAFGLRDPKSDVRRPRVRFLRYKIRRFGEAQFALREGSGEHLLDVGFLAVFGHRQLTDQQIACPLQHLLLAEGERLGLVQ